MNDQEKLKKAETIVKELLKKLEVEAEIKSNVELEEDVKFINIVLTGENLGMLIGFRGNTLNALQSLVNQMLAKELGETVNVLIDVNDYRKRRVEYLKNLASKALNEAKESKQNVELAPLSPYERRIIHLELKDQKDITTVSEGEGENRHIIVKYEPKEEK